MKKFGGLAVLLIVLVVAVAIVGSQSFYQVPEGYVAALYQFGKLSSVEATTGLRMKVPFVQSVRLIDVKEQSKEMVQNAYTKDTQTVENLIVKVNYRLNVAEVESVIKNIGVDMVEDKIIIPNVYAITRNAIGQYTADELIAHRSEVTQKIHDQLSEVFEGKGLTLVSFTIQNIDFEDSFEAAVRRKVEAEQKALEAQNRTKEEEELARQEVIRAQAEADAIRARAEAEAFAIEVINAQLSNSPHYVEYLTATKWNGQLPLVTGTQGGQMLDISALLNASPASEETIVPEATAEPVVTIP